MSGIISKARALFLGNLHSLLDRAIDETSPAVVKQYVRDLGVAKEKLANEAAGASGDAANLQRRSGLITAKREEAEHNIDLILEDGDPANDHLAEPIAAKIIGYNKELETLATEIVTAQTTARQLAEAASRLEAKYQQMVSLQRQLESADRSASAKEQAADALSAATSAAGATSNIDNLEDRIRRRGAVADAKLARAMGEMADSVDLGVVGVQARELIAKRRAAKSAATQTEPATTGS